MENKLDPWVVVPECVLAGVILICMLLLLRRLDRPALTQYLTRPRNLPTHLSAV